MAKKKKTPGILISRKGLLIWISLVIFIAGWMFVLGIIVGRGAAPVNLEMGKLEQELADLKAKMFRQEKAKLDAQSSGKGSESPELGFYEALKSSKRSEPFKSLPQASTKPIKVPKPINKVPAPKPVPRTKPKPVAKTKPVTPPKSVKPPQPAARKVAQKGQFAIQVAASKDAKSAEKLVNTLRRKGFKAYQIRTKVAGKGIWYRVRVGAYQDQGAAGKMLSKLKAGSYDGMIVRTK